MAYAVISLSCAESRVRVFKLTIRLKPKAAQGPFTINVRAEIEKSVGHYSRMIPICHLMISDRKNTQHLTFRSITYGALIDYVAGDKGGRESARMFRLPAFCHLELEFEGCSVSEQRSCAGSLEPPLGNGPAARG